MTEWKLESTAPIETPVLVWDGATIAVGRLKTYKTGRMRVWWIDESFGFNEDGEIVGVTHWTELPLPPTGGCDAQK
jgi:hypothetical protein